MWHVSLRLTPSNDSSCKIPRKPDTASISLLVHRQRCSCLMQGQPSLQLADMERLFRHKLCGKSLDFRIFGGVEDILVEGKACTFRIQRDPQRLLTTEKRISSPNGGRLRAFDIRPVKLVGMKNWQCSKPCARARVAHVQPRVIGEAAK